MELSRSAKKRQSKTKPDPKQPLKNYRKILAVGVGAATLLLLAAFFFPAGKDSEYVYQPSGNRLSPDPSGTESQESPQFALPSKVEYEGRAVEQQRLLEEIELLQKEYPTDAAILHISGLAHLEASQFERGTSDLEKAIQLAPTKEDSLLVLADAYVKSGKQEIAVEVLEKGIERGIHSSSIFLAMGDTLGQLGRTEEGIMSLEKSAKIDPKNAKPYGYLVQSLVELGKFSEAEKAAERAIELGSNDVAVYSMWAVALTRQGKKEKAQEVRAKTPKFESSSEADVVLLENTFLESTSYQYAVLGSICLSHKSEKKAEQLLLKALQLNPKSAMSIGVLADIYYRQGRVKNCMIAYQKMVEIQPENLTSHWNLANLAMANRNTALAEATLLNAVQLDKTGATDLLLAKLLMNVRKPEKVVSHARTAVEKLGSVDAYLVLIDALHFVGDGNSANQELAKAKRLAPNDPRLTQR